MRLLYDKVYEQIRKTDFESLWKGFHAYHFALYNSDSVYFKDKTGDYEECFLGNTSIKYGDEQIAIWRVDDYTKEDPVLLAANIIHEMFHAYQYECREKRFPDDLKALDYPIVSDNILLKYAENQQIVKAVKSNDRRIIKECLSSVFASRARRKELIKEYIDYEYKMETVEGVAEYIGLCALKQLDYEKYENKINKYIDNLADTDNILFDNRRLAYYSGCLLLIALKQADICFFHDISKETKTVYELVAEGFPASDLPEILHKYAIEESLKHYIDNRKKLFSDFFSKNPECTEKSFKICGYDPMNMVKLDNLVWCKYFVMLKEKAKEDPLLIYNQVVLKVDETDTTSVSAYYTV